MMREQRLMNTPMAIEGISKSRGISKDELIRERDARVPLGQKMGTVAGKAPGSGERGVNCAG